MEDKNDATSQKVLRAYAESLQDIGRDYCAEDISRFIFGSTKLQKPSDLTAQVLEMFFHYADALKDSQKKVRRSLHY